MDTNQCGSCKLGITQNTTNPFFFYPLKQLADHTGVFTINDLSKFLQTNTNSNLLTKRYKGATFFHKISSVLSSPDMNLKKIKGIDQMYNAIISSDDDNSELIKVAKALQPYFACKYIKNGTEYTVIDFALNRAKNADELMDPNKKIVAFVLKILKVIGCTNEGGNYYDPEHINDLKEIDKRDKIGYFDESVKGDDGIEYDGDSDSRSSIGDIRDSISGSTNRSTISADTPCSDALAASQQRIDELEKQNNDLVNQIQSRTQEQGVPNPKKKVFGLFGGKRTPTVSRKRRTKRRTMRRKYKRHNHQTKRKRKSRKN